MQNNGKAITWYKIVQWEAKQHNIMKLSIRSFASCSVTELCFEVNLQEDRQCTTKSVAIDCLHQKQGANKKLKIPYCAWSRVFMFLFEFLLRVLEYI